MTAHKKKRLPKRPRLTEKKKQVKIWFQNRRYKKKRLQARLSLKSCKDIRPFHNNLKIPLTCSRIGTPLPVGLTNTQPLSTVTLTPSQPPLYFPTGQTPSDYFTYPTAVMNVKPTLLPPPSLPISSCYQTPNMTLTTIAPNNTVIT